MKLLPSVFVYVILRAFVTKSNFLQRTRISPDSSFPGRIHGPCNTAEEAWGYSVSILFQILDFGVFFKMLPTVKNLYLWKIMLRN